MLPDDHFSNMTSEVRSFYFYCLDQIYNDMKETIDKMVNQDLLDSQADPEALWQELMERPMHGGILLTFYYWLQNTRITQQERNDCVEWLKTDQWNKLPCLGQIFHIYHAWETQKSFTT